MCPICSSSTRSARIEFHWLRLHHMLIPEPVTVAKRNALIGLGGEELVSQSKIGVLLPEKGRWVPGGQKQQMPVLVLGAMSKRQEKSLAGGKCGLRPHLWDVWMESSLGCFRTH